MEQPQKEEKKDRDIDTSSRPDKNFLVSENHNDVDASGVDDNSTGKKEDYLGKLNVEEN
ncbi:hypothetical protein G8759_16790 [Spirosoma aureum]|uniref:Uncharacterized protein n=1 Tax=Spirosoma aureum TaxID=2692134 RepID=A0A6G9APL8_9BACT|nr:hypothetical protein [Spirosoma aureum]QIP14153.1 hypothetical protein G8759_16790 [Spirosoma aureum]